MKNKKYKKLENVYKYDYLYKKNISLIDALLYIFFLCGTILIICLTIFCVSALFVAFKEGLFTSENVKDMLTCADDSE